MEGALSHQKAPDYGAALEQLRRIALALPEVTERISHGAPSFFVRAKNLVATMHVTHDDRLSLWVGVYLDTDVDWDEIAQIVGDSFRCIAPKRLIAELD